MHTLVEAMAIPHPDAVHLVNSLQRDALLLTRTHLTTQLP
jgi:hypothetical protein